MVPEFIGTIIILLHRFWRASIEVGQTCSGSTGWDASDPPVQVKSSADRRVGLRQKMAGRLGSGGFEMAQLPNGQNHSPSPRTGTRQSFAC